LGKYDGDGDDGKKKKIKEEMGYVILY